MTTLPIWNALRRSYLKLLLFLLRPIVSLSLLLHGRRGLLLKASFMNTLGVMSMVEGRDPVNRLVVPEGRSQIDAELQPVSI